MGLTLYLLRHGQTPFSRDNSFCGSGLDPELTADGAAMAEEFAAMYRTQPWEAVYASPLRRTLATARPLCAAIGIEPQIRDGLKEIGYGQWEGQTTESVDANFHDDYIRWNADPAWYPPTGGEPAMAIAHRVGRVMEEVATQHRAGNVLIVSHKATIRILLCVLLGIDVGRFRYRLACPVGSVSAVEFGRHGPLLLALADRMHLSERLRSLQGT